MPSHMLVEEDPKGQGWGAGPQYPAQEPPERQRHGIPVWVFILTLVLGLAAGALVGFFFPKEEIAYLHEKTSITSEELDSTVASYTLGNAIHEITAREALESTASLESQQNEDGTYPMPSAETILNVARNQLLQGAVEDEGIEVGDQDIESYKQQVFGSEDVSTLAEKYSMSEEQFEQMLAEGAGVELLYEKVVGTHVDGSRASVPELPPVPEAGEEGTPTAEYGAYVVGLLGDNWDNGTNTWANRDNPYYAVMANDVFSIDGATYDQAMEAYYVAYSQQVRDYAPGLDAWDAYLADLLAQAEITIGELVQ